MARPIKPGKHDKQFKKGHFPTSQTIVKGHNLAMTSEEIQTRKLTARQVLSVIQNFTNMKAQDLPGYLLNPDISVLELSVGRLFADVINHGDHQKLAFLFDRSLGKVKEKVEITMPKPTIIRLRNGEESVALGPVYKDEEE